MVLENELGVLHRDRLAAAETVCHTGHASSIGHLSTHPHVTHLFQQGQTYSSKATPPKSAPSYGPIIQTHESMRVIPIQTAIVRK